MSVIFADISDLEVLNFDRDIWALDLGAAPPDIEWPNSIGVTDNTKFRLATGFINKPYDCTFTVSDWATPISFALYAGSLPAGLAMENVETSPDVGACRIFGTPTEAGYFKFTVRATNSEGAGNKELSLPIINPTGGLSSGICLVV